MRRIPKTVTTVMLTTLGVGLTGLLAESVSDVSWLPIRGNDRNSRHCYVRAAVV